MTPSRLCIRDVQVDGRPNLDVCLEAGLVVSVGHRAPRFGPDLDGRGGALIPGFADHHLHLFATAAQSHSADLGAAASLDDLRRRLLAAAAGQAPGSWLRATGCPPALAETLGAADLDLVLADHPIRLQDQSGALWVLNSAALRRLDIAQAPPGLERDAAGQPTGRLWRADAWLRDQLGGSPPDLRPLGAALASKGVVALTDATVSTTPAAASRLAHAHRAGDLPQRLQLMSAAALPAPEDGAFRVGPVKVVLDERDLPSLEEMIARIGEARAWRRPVAVHCVTATELAFTLAAFAAAGARPGDRIEHAGVVPDGAIAELEALRLTVVTQPGFIAAHGDRYLTEVDPAEQDDLYRCARLIEAGVPVAFGSDAPYGPIDPWAILQAAVRRRTRRGRIVGAGERLDAASALRRFWGALDDPGGPSRRVVPGQPADLCLLKAPLPVGVGELSADLVAATLVAGRVVYLSP